MKKLCNFRVIPAIMITMIIGIVSIYLVFYEEHFHTAPYFVSIYALFGIVILVLFMIYRIRAIRFIVKHMYIIFVIVLTLLITLASSYMVFTRYDNMESIYDVSVEARVCDIVEYDSYTLVECSDVYVGDTKVDYHIQMYVYEGMDVVVGSKISMVCDLRVAKLYDDSINLYPFINNTPYKVYVYSDVDISSGYLKPNEYVKQYVVDMLSKSMTFDSYTIAYGMLFGVKDEMSADLYQVFSLSGIAHILALSGLHISVLVMAIKLVLDRIKMHKAIYVGILASILLMYMYLCGFTASIVRASIMAMVLVIAKILGREYDSISSLAFSGVVYLCIYPMGLFSVGFQLSYLCVLAIITLSPSVKKVLTKIHIPKCILDSLSISIAVNIVLLPISANVFDKVSMVGLVANLVVLPIFSIVYVMLFVLTLLSMVPIFRVLLVVVDICIGVIVHIARYMAQMHMLVLDMYYIPYIAVFWIMATILGLKYMLVGRKTKVILVSILTIISSMYMIGGMLPNTFIQDTLIVESQYSSNVSIVTIDGKVILVGAKISKYDIKDIVKSNKISTIDYIVAYDIDDISSLDVFSGYKVGVVYVPFMVDSECEYNVEHIDKAKDTLPIHTYTISDKVVAVGFSIGTDNILFIRKDVTKNELINLAGDIDIAYTYTVCFSLKYYLPDFEDISLGKVIYQSTIDIGYLDTINMSKEYKYTFILD